MCLIYINLSHDEEPSHEQLFQEDNIKPDGNFVQSGTNTFECLQYATILIIIKSKPEYFAKRQFIR